MISSSNSQLVNLVQRTLPALSGSSVHLDTRNNQYCTTAYTSAAGNSYYQGIRLSDRLIINVDYGQGYAYLFMNGLKLYCFNGGSEKKLIGSRYYNCCCYSLTYARSEAEEMLLEYLKSQCALSGTNLPEHQLKELSKAMVEEAFRNSPKAIA